MLRRQAVFRDDATGEIVLREHGTAGDAVDSDRRPPTAPQADAADRLPGHVIDLGRAKKQVIAELGQAARDLASTYPELLDALNGGDWRLARDTVDAAAAAGVITTGQRDQIVATLDDHGIPDPG